MIFSLVLIIYNYERDSMSRVLHTSTWDYFTERLPDRFIHSPKVLKKAIKANINDLVQELWRTSSDRILGASFLPLRRLFGILQDILEVCFVLNPFLRLPSA